MVARQSQRPQSTLQSSGSVKTFTQVAKDTGGASVEDDVDVSDTSGSRGRFFSNSRRVVHTNKRESPDLYP